MTVISAWWRSNIPFQRLSGRLNYYIIRWDRMSVSWRSDELETRYSRESHHPAEGPLGPPIEFGDQTRLCAGMRTCPREAGPPGPLLSSRGERDRERHTAMSGGDKEVNMLPFCSISSSLSHPNLSNKVRGIFLRTVSLVFIIASICILHVYDYICIFIICDNTTHIMTSKKLCR